MQTAFDHRIQRHWRRTTFGGLGLFLAVSGVACSNPGYRTLVYPGQQGQYTLQHVPETPSAPAQYQQPVQSSLPPVAPSGAQASAATPTPAPAAVVPATAQTDENLNQVQTMWPKLSDSDKALLAATAKRLAGQR